MQFNTSIGKETLTTYISELKEKKKKIAATLKSLRSYCCQYGIKQTIDNIVSVPGIGFTTAIMLFAELVDINRFSTIDELCSYVGLVPSVDSTGDKERVLGISRRHDKFLRNILIETAWIAVRKDPALTLRFSQLTARMSKQRAIIRITKKLLNRIRFVWKNNKKYKMMIITQKTRNNIRGKAMSEAKQAEGVGTVVGNQFICQYTKLTYTISSTPKSL